jgi:hypothetical protein
MTRTHRTCRKCGRRKLKAAFCKTENVNRRGPVTCDDCRTLEDRLWKPDELVMLMQGRLDIPGRTHDAAKEKARHIGAPGRRKPSLSGEQLTELFQAIRVEGLSYTEAAARFKTTRNVIAGLVHRNREKILNIFLTLKDGDFQGAYRG